MQAFRKSLKETVRRHRSVGQAARFVVVGGTATLLHYVIYYLLMDAMALNLAFAIGYFVSFLYNFALSSLFTFSVRPTLMRFVRFSLSHVVNYCLQAALLNLFLYVGVPSAWAPLPVYAVSVPVNFLLVRLALLFKTNNKKS